MKKIRKKNAAKLNMHKIKSDYLRHNQAFNVCIKDTAWTPDMVDSMFVWSNERKLIIRRIFIQHMNLPMHRMKWLVENNFDLSWFVCNLSIPLELLIDMLFTQQNCSSAYMNDVYDHPNMTDEYRMLAKLKGII